MTLYMASSNAGKLRELQRTASDDGVEVLPLPGLAGIAAPPEDAETFAGNAAQKALAYARHAPGLLVLADDSGLEVEALDGRPGVHSARFAGEHGFFAGSGLSQDERNLQYLLFLLRAKDRTVASPVSRRARFVCALAVARDGKVLLQAEGVAEGDLLPEPRGSDGFGYDPLFQVRGFDRTMAELSREQKWAVSHRGAAFRELLGQLRRATL